MKKLLASFILGLGLLTLAPLSLAQAPATDPAPAAADVAAPAPAATPAPQAPAPAAAAPPPPPPPRAPDAPPRAAAAEQPAAAAAAPEPVPNKGDTAWMMTATLLVVLMMPGLALFYGGLVRSKNMLSVLMQVMVTFSLIMVLWFIYGYSLAFTEGGPFIGGLDRLFMRGIWDNDTGTFANGA